MRVWWAVGALVITVSIAVWFIRTPESGTPSEQRVPRTTLGDVVRDFNQVTGENGVKGHERHLFAGTA